MADTAATATATATQAEETITISKAYLAELEAIRDQHYSRFEYLRKKDKENPEGVRERSQKYYEKNRDEINTRRRAARLLKKQETRDDNTPTRDTTQRETTSLKPHDQKQV